MSEIIEGFREPANFGYTALHLSLRQIEGGYFLIAVKRLRFAGQSAIHCSGSCWRTGRGRRRGAFGESARGSQGWSFRRLLRAVCRASV